MRCSTSYCSGASTDHGALEPSAPAAAERGRTVSAAAIAETTHDGVFMAMRGAASAADRIGVVGATLAALCCLGTPAVVSLLAALGLGFLIKDAVLVPLLLGSLILVIWGLAAGWRRHRRPTALIIGAAAAPLLVAFSVLAPARPMAYLSIAALVGASVLNAVLSRHARPQLLLADR